MTKTPEEMCKDILKSLRMEDAPEGVLIEVYLDVIIKRHRNEAIEEYKQSISNVAKQITCNGSGINEDYG